MAVYKLRAIRFDEWGNVHPVGRRLRRLALPERLHPGGVYCLDRQMYRVERVL